MQKIFGVVNLKGGVCKTSLTQNLAVALAVKGKKVLVIDSDPQANLSAGFGLASSGTDNSPYVFQVLSGEKKICEVSVNCEGVDVVPSRLDLSVAQISLEHLPGRDLLLKRALQKCKESGTKYDLVLLDSPPQLGLLAQNVLAASDGLIVPVESEFYSLMGMGLLEQTVARFRDFLTPDLAIRAVILTRHDPRKQMHQQVEEQLSSAYPNTVFKTHIRENIAISEASSQGKSVLTYDPKCNGAQDYIFLADEWCKQIGC